MGTLFERYFSLLAGRTPGVEYGVIASPADESQWDVVASDPDVAGCLCRAC